MKDKVIARSYAEAFLMYAGRNAGMERAVRDLAYIRKVVSAHEQLRSFLGSSEIGSLEKYSLLETVFQKEISADTRLFLWYLCKKLRVSWLIEIAEYAEHIYLHDERAEGILRSAEPLDEEMTARISDYLSNKLRKKVALKTEIDPGLIAGVQVIIENTIIDGSLRRRLDELKGKLLSIKAG